DNQHQLESQRRDLENKISAESAEYEFDLPTLLEHRSLQLFELDNKVVALEVALAERNIDPSKPIEQSAAAQPHADRTAEQIAMVDRTMSDLLNQRRSAHEVIDRLRMQGYLESHPERQRAAAEL